MKNSTIGYAVYNAAAWVILAAVAAVGAEQLPPDLTRGETEGGGCKVDLAQTYNLGPTGLRGWIYTRPQSDLDAKQGRTTAISRQILVTHVGAGSPAEGVLAVNDVILGVNGKLFADDARKSIGRAITEAEKERNGGVLKLTRFREGGIEEVQLRLRVMGSYSQTAPYDCPKSKRILEDACKVLEKEELEKISDIWGSVNALALLATGKAEYLPRVKKYARSLSAKEVVREGGGAWDCGYVNLFLCEYYLLSGDQEVLPAIKVLTLKMAQGQGMYGTFGHGFSMKTPEGELHGPIPPYGPVNQSGLIANLGIMMGQKCGIDDKEVKAAIWRSAKFFEYFVDKGGIPYGEHEPWLFHENNGKNSLAAVMFSMLKGESEATRYYAKMATAAYANREYGHTGQGFSYLWSTLGANVGGPAAAAAFFNEAAWHFDLMRRCDGSFTYDGGEQYGAGKTDDNTYYGRNSYAGLSPNATYVLTFCLPLKKLYITGRGADRANWLSDKEVAQVIASGCFDLHRKECTARELAEAFNDWSPVVRSWAAEELATRPEVKQIEQGLISMAEGSDKHLRQGACETLGNIRSKEALPVFVRLLTHEDRWLRIIAAKALEKMGDAVKPVVPDMLTALVDTAEPLQPIGWDDPVQLSQGALARTLLRNGGIRSSLKAAAPDQFYPAIRVVSRNADGMTRALLRGMFTNELTLEDVEALAPDILAALRIRAPADTMFGNEIRMGAFKALVKYHYVEGIQEGVDLAKTQGGHGSERRTGEIMQDIKSYGSAARVAVPGLRELIAQFNDEVKNRKFPGGELNQMRVGAVEEAIQFIESATTHPELRRIRK